VAETLVDMFQSDDVLSHFKRPPLYSS
jgi:hypothetical protein